MMMKNVFLFYGMTATVTEMKSVAADPCWFSTHLITVLITVYLDSPWVHLLIVTQ